MLSLTVCMTALAGDPPTDLTLVGEVTEGQFGGLEMKLRFKQIGEVDFWDLYIDGDDAFAQVSAQKDGDDGWYVSETFTIPSYCYREKGTVKVQLMAEFADRTYSDLSEVLTVDVSAFTEGGGEAKKLLKKTHGVRYIGDENGTKDREFAYYYDAEANQAAQVNKLTSGETTVNWSINEYDEEGRVVRTRSYLKDAFKYDFKEYSYDDAGNVASMTVWKTNPKDASTGYRVSAEEYTYTAAGVLEKTRMYEGNYVTGDLTHTYSYIYSGFDAEGRHPATLSITTDDESYAGVVYHLTYDADGNLVKQSVDEDKRGDFPGFEWNNPRTSCEEWTYDGEHRVLTHASYGWMPKMDVGGNTEWPKIDSEEFVYDGTRNCINKHIIRQYGDIMADDGLTLTYGVKSFTTDVFTYNEIEYAKAYTPQGLSAESPFGSDKTTLIWFAPQNTVSLKGFNVFENGVKLNAEPVTATNYETAYKAEAMYFVQSVYENNDGTFSELNVSNVVLGMQDVPVHEGGAPELRIKEGKGMALTLAFSNPDYVPEGLEISRYMLMTESGVLTESPVDGGIYNYEEGAEYTNSIFFQVAQSETFYVRTYYSDGSKSDLSNAVFYDPAENMFPAPLDVRVARAEGGNVTLAWRAPENVSSEKNAKVIGYCVYLSTDPEMPLNGNDLITDTYYKMQTGTMRNALFEVRAVYEYDGFNQNGEQENGMRGFSRKIRAELNGTHQIVTGVTATAQGDGTVSVTWNEPDSNLEINSYNVYLDGQPATEATGRTATLSAADGSHTVTVTANYQYGDAVVESPMSDEAQVNVGTGITGIDADALGADFYDLQGRRVSGTQKGVVIKVTKNADGTSTAAKTVR